MREKRVADQDNLHETNPTLRKLWPYMMHRRVVGRLIVMPHIAYQLISRGKTKQMEC
jgi:hypothetical protein